MYTTDPYHRSKSYSPPVPLHLIYSSMEGTTVMGTRIIRNLRPVVTTPLSERNPGFVGEPEHLKLGSIRVTTDSDAGYCKVYTGQK